MGDEKVVTEQRRNGADKRYAYQHWNALIAGGLTGTLPRQKCCAGQLTAVLLGIGARHRLLPAQGSAGGQLRVNELVPALAEG